MQMMKRRAEQHNTKLREGRANQERTDVTHTKQTQTQKKETDTDTEQETETETERHQKRQTDTHTNGQTLPLSEKPSLSDPTSHTLASHCMVAIEIHRESGEMTALYASSAPAGCAAGVGGSGWRFRGLRRAAVVDGCARERVCGRRERVCVCVRSYQGRWA